jgi:hypothetical protein
MHSDFPNALYKTQPVSMTFFTIRITQQRIKEMEDNIGDEAQRVFDVFPEGDLKQHCDRAVAMF